MLTMDVIENLLSGTKTDRARLDLINKTMKSKCITWEQAQELVEKFQIQDQSLIDSTPDVV